MYGSFAKAPDTIKQEGITSLKNISPFEKFENQIIELDSYVNKGGLLVMHFTKYDFNKIMMAHRPDSFIFNNATKNWDVDLVVSGHTHGGQVVLPFWVGYMWQIKDFFQSIVKVFLMIQRFLLPVDLGLESRKYLDLIISQK